MKTPTTIDNISEVKSVLEHLFNIFDQAAKMQKASGNRVDDDYSHLAIKEQYREYCQQLSSIAIILENHDFDINKIFATAIDPKLKPDGTPLFRTSDKLNKLPMLPSDKDAIINKALKEVNHHPHSHLW